MEKVRRGTVEKVPCIHTFFIEKSRKKKEKGKGRIGVTRSAKTRKENSTRCEITFVCITEFRVLVDCIPQLDSTEPPHMARGNVKFVGPQVTL
jgi:hypothetical protein